MFIDSGRILGVLGKEPPLMTTREEIKVEKVNDFLYVEFKEFQSAVTPGQFIAIYQKNQLIASGVIL